MYMLTSKMKSTMKEYVFYTTEGTTLSPNQMEVENLQILSFERAENAESAWVSFQQNFAVEKHGFSLNKVLCREIGE